MNKIYAKIAFLAITFLLSSCARTFVNSAQVPENRNFTAKERVEAMADKKAIDYCAKFGHKGYEKVEMSSTRRAVSSGNLRCETVPVKCPELFTKNASVPQNRTCLEYQCIKDATDWTAKLAFRCR